MIIKRTINAIAMHKSESTIAKTSMTMINVPPEFIKPKKPPYALPPTKPSMRLTTKITPMSIGSADSEPLMSAPLKFMCNAIHMLRSRKKNPLPNSDIIEDKISPNTSHIYWNEERPAFVSLNTAI